MTKVIVALGITALLILALAGCSDSTPPENTTFNRIALQPINFPTLKSGLVYEGWVANIDNDSNWIEYKSFGKFFWDEYNYRFLDAADTNAIIDSVFVVNGDIYHYNLIGITLEPFDGNDAPSPTVIAQAAIIRDQATHMVFPADFSAASGVFTIATFSDGNFRSLSQPKSNEYNGLWFLEISDVGNDQDSTETYRLGLELPVLPDSGYVYQGWAALPTGDTVTTGRFYFPDYQDYDNNHCADRSFPNFPGEDFIRNVPKSYSFVNGGTAFVTIEPNPDNNPTSPSNLVVLQGNLPKTDTEVRRSSFPMENIGPRTFPYINVVFLQSK